MLTSGTPAKNWAGNTVFNARQVHRPASVEELRDIVGSASRVRALGSGHSFNRIADTSGDLVRLDGLPPLVELEAQGEQTVTVSAGMRYGEVATVLHTAGSALANLASLPHISVAGCCATATHGSGDSEKCLAAAVTALEFVGADGDVTEVSRHSDPEGFPGMVVALGALGIVTRLTLSVEPAFEVSQHVYTGVPLDRLADGFDEIFGCAYSVSAFTDYRSGQARVWLKRRTAERDGSRRPPGWEGQSPAGAAHHPIPRIPPTHCTEQLGVPGPWHERLPHFRPDFTPSNGEELQSELLLPRASAPAALAALQELGARIAPVLQISEVRTVAADDLWLSPAYRQDCVAFHFTWVKDTAAVLPVIEAVEERLLPLGARPHWGKLTAMPPELTASLYERAGDFRQLLLERDPHGKFGNTFVEQIFAPGYGD